MDNLNEKNSILNQAIAGIDSFLLNNKTLQDNQTAFAELKSIRDELLIKGIQLGSYSLEDIVSAQVYYAIDLQYAGQLAQDNLRQTVATTAGINSIISLTANQALNHNPPPPD